MADNDMWWPSSRRPVCGVSGFPRFTTCSVVRVWSYEETRFINGEVGLTLPCNWQEPHRIDGEHRHMTGDGDVIIWHGGPIGDVT